MGEKKGKKKALNLNKFMTIWLFEKMIANNCLLLSLLYQSSWQWVFSWPFWQHIHKLCPMTLDMLQLIQCDYPHAIEDKPFISYGMLSKHVWRKHDGHAWCVCTLICVTMHMFSPYCRNCSVWIKVAYDLCDHHLKSLTWIHFTLDMVGSYVHGIDWNWVLIFKMIKIEHFSLNLSTIISISIYFSLFNPQCLACAILKNTCLHMFEWVDVESIETQ